MKKGIVVTVIIICVFSVFVKREVTVVDSKNNSSVPYASIFFAHSRTVADVNGNASFVSSIFQRRIKVQRLGFKEREILLPFRFFYSKNKFFLAEADYPEITEQINSILKGMRSYTYSYTLSVTSGAGKTQTQSVQATYDGRNFIFDNRSDFTGVNYKILYKNGNLYLWKNNGFQLLQGKDKDKFTSQNILFIQISDVVTSLLLGKAPSNILVDKDEVHIAWDNGGNKAALLVVVDKSGFPVNFNFSNKSSGKTYSIQLKIQHINEQISVRR